MDGYKKERSGEGRYMVYADGRRIGFVCGGRGNWCAERGPHTVGYYPTVAGACRAIYEAHKAAASLNTRRTMRGFIEDMVALAEGRA